MPQADFVLRGGQIVTMDPGRPSASAAAVRGDRIAAIGTDAEIEHWVGPDTRTVELSGRAVLPGFIDVHTHVAGNARDLRNIECRDFFDPSIVSFEDIYDRLRRAHAGLPAGEWVVAVASPMQETRLKERRRPTKADLDDVVPDRPAYITFGPHLLLANSAALEACGIGRDTADPHGGAIEREPDGAPSGLLREVAQQLVRNRRPGAEQDLVDRLEAELLTCARRGVTTIHDVVTTPAEIRAYQTLDMEGRMPLRVRLLVRVFQSQIPTWAIRDLGVLPGFGSDRVQIGGIKLSVDGGSSAGQAAFYPLDGADPREHPVLRMTQSELDEIVGAYHGAGVQVAVHAVGDMAADMALRSFEAALANTPRPDHRHRVEHLGNLAVSAERLQAARRLELIAVPNPSGFHYLGATSLKTYGRERLGRIYPFRWMIDEGLPFVGASDGGGLWPVDPLRDVAACVTRLTRGGEPIDEHEAISVEEALGGYTSRAAYAGFGEARFGTLEIGKAADLTVLAANPLTVDARDLAGIDVDITVCGGRVAFERQPAVAAASG